MSRITRLYKAAITGEYDVQGHLSEADCIIGQSFGHVEENISRNRDPNFDLALCLYNRYDPLNLPKLLQSEVADYYSEISGHTSELIISEHRTAGKYLDSWDVLAQAIDYMKSHDLQKPLLVAQAHHIGRVALQAQMLGLDPVVPANLPSNFSPESTQKWTHNKHNWVLRELPVLAILATFGNVYAKRLRD